MVQWVNHLRNNIFVNPLKYRIAQNFGGGKLWRIDCYRVFGEENVGEFTIATISYSSEPGIWLGKTWANDVRFAKFAQVFPHQSFALYGTFIL